MRKGLVIAVMGIVLTAITSCRTISSLLHDDGVVAQVNDVKLYRAELNALIPKGMSPADSAELAQKYINSWASDLVYLKVAEQQLSKSEKDVTKELEDYRKSLLKYRYEQLYVNERLDTTVTEDAVQEYYDAHPEKFILKRPLLRARYLNIQKDSPALKQLKKMMKSSDPNVLMEADSIAYSVALKFTTWNNEWIDAAVMAREFGQDYASVLAGVSKGWNERTDTSGVVNAAYVTEIVPKGAMSPLEYSAPFIKDMIISARKQALVSALEHDLLEDARVNGKFVITE